MRVGYGRQNMFQIQIVYKDGEVYTSYYCTTVEAHFYRSGFCHVVQVLVTSFATGMFAAVIG